MKNKILIDINHPAHVHLFRNVAKELESAGWDILFTTRNKEFAPLLLQRYKLPYILMGKHYKSMKGKLLGIIKYDLKLLKIAFNYKPDLILSMGSVYAAHVSFFTKVPHIMLQDTENATLQNKLSIPFADVILNPECYGLRFGKKQILYPGYHELAYLNDVYFHPDDSILNQLGINKGEKYMIIRWVSWNANHDVGHNGMTLENKIYAVKEFVKHSKVFITSEEKLPEELEPYRIKIPIEKIHDAIFYSSLLFGESATMASEAAALGVPSIYIDNDGRGYTDEIESKYSLVFNFDESENGQKGAISKAVDILTSEELKKEIVNSYNRMKSEKINLTKFLCWFITNYPNSIDKKYYPKKFREFLLNTN